MFLFRKKNILRRLYNRYSGLMPLVSVFLLSIFGTSIYYKNQPATVTDQQASYSAKVEAVTNQLNNEKDITDSLSSKNIELKQRLKDVLSKASSSGEEAKVTKLSSELDQEKKNNQTLHDENARLKVRVNNMLAKIEATKSISKSNAAEVVAKTTEGSRNTIQPSKASNESAKDNNFNKVKMDMKEDSQIEKTAESSTSRNNTQKITKKDEKVATKASSNNSSNNNERTMELQQGESLWDLSKRAYGKGILYKKIIKANPSITEKSFKKLRPGAVINVPL